MKRKVRFFTAIGFFSIFLLAILPFYSKGGQGQSGPPNKLVIKVSYAGHLGQAVYTIDCVPYPYDCLNEVEVTAKR